ncbi:MAG TPA: metalloregulator ArsR/SmtB family transcription factor [Deinococcales bacterium]|nr:metalloregulator ArsR/SmtB family transcription factor [Deinococcales bacterium]
MRPTETAEPVLSLLTALANETRFRLLRLLHGADLCVCELEALTGLGQSKLSYHLAILRDAGLVSSREDGRWNVYHLERRSLMYLSGMVEEALSAPVDLSPADGCRTGACAPDPRRARPALGAAR